MEKLCYLRGTGLGFAWGRLTAVNNFFHMQLRWGQAAQGDIGQQQGRSRDNKVFLVERLPAHGKTFRSRYQGGFSGKRIV